MCIGIEMELKQTNLDVSRLTGCTAAPGFVMRLPYSHGPLQLMLLSPRVFAVVGGVVIDSVRVRGMQKV